MKATYRNGKGSAAHNDRKYLSATKEEESEVVSKWQLFKECDTFHENELKAYEQLFGEWLKGVNDRKIKDGHPDRCKTMAEILGKPNEEKKRGKFEPVETILQIGKDGEEVDEAVFRACVNEFIGKTQQIYGNHMQWLDFAVHQEESSVLHAHGRRVWYAIDEMGCAYPAKKEALVQLGQENEELRAAGFEVRPDDDRYSNATTRQTEAERQLWYDICKSHGIDLDTEPDKTNTKHLSVKEYKYKAEQETKEAIKQIDANKKKQIEEANEKATNELVDYKMNLDEVVKEQKNKELENKLKKLGLTHELQFDDFAR